MGGMFARQFISFLPSAASRRRSMRATGCLLQATIFTAVLIAGCENGLREIDRKTQALLVETNRGLGAHARTPPVLDSSRISPSVIETVDSRDVTAKNLPTVDPPADELHFTSATAEEAQDVIGRLERYRSIPPDAMLLTLRAALSYAMTHSREYRTAEEEFVLAALRLLIERHRWGPRFFNDTSAIANAVGDDGMYDTALELVNEFRVTQRLPYGGEVSARALAVAAQDLHQRIAGENFQRSELILDANIPLLRNAGLIAQEDLIQAERNVIYAAREFERFRRDFLFSITSDFLDLVVQKLGIRNAERQVQQLEQLEKRQIALVEAGRTPPYEAGLAAQDTLFARDNLNNREETYRLALDRFKVRLGMETLEPIAIEIALPDLPPPATPMDSAVAAAMEYRLDLQNRRDRLDDSRRGVDNARNQLLPDLNLTGSATLATDPDVEYGGVEFDVGEINARGGITFGLPLDREIERVNVRQSQINLERAMMEYERFRDEVAVNVRGAIRNIDTAIFSLQLQEENIRVNEVRRASLEADLDRATARDRSEAIQQLNQAEDARDQAARDLQLAILGYLLETGQLRVAADGTLQMLPGITPVPIDVGDPVPEVPGT